MIGKKVTNIEPKWRPKWSQNGQQIDKKKQWSNNYSKDDTNTIQRWALLGPRVIKTRYVILVLLITPWSGY